MKCHVPLPQHHGTGIFTYIYHKNQPNIGKYTIKIIWLLIDTLPKTNSSPMKRGRAPKGNDRIPTIHVQVRTVGCRESTYCQYDS